MGRNQEVTLDCPYEGPRQNVGKWEKLGADPVLIRAIKVGVFSPLHNALQPNVPYQTEMSQQLMETIGEYSDSGVIAP